MHTEKFDFWAGKRNMQESNRSKFRTTDVSRAIMENHLLTLAFSNTPGHNRGLSV